MSTHAQPVPATTPSMRVVLVQAKTCRHRWTIRTRRTNAQLAGDHKMICPECRGRMDNVKARRRVQVLESERKCRGCGVVMHHLHDPEDDMCGPCDMRRSARERLLSLRGLDAIKAAEREAVFAALPGTLPDIVLRLAGMRGAWLAAQRVIGEAKKTGEVVEWNVPGCRTVYRLVEGAE